MTTYGATGDDNFVKLTIFGFQYGSIVILHMRREVILKDMYNWLGPILLAQINLNFRLDK